MDSGLDMLEQARQELNLTLTELWMRYFALGGMSSPLEIDAILHGALVASAHERDLLAVALNERFTELGGDHPLPYEGDV